MAQYRCSRDGSSLHRPRSYRKALLERLGLAFEVAAPQVDERALHGEAPGDTALRLSALKAQALEPHVPRRADHRLRPGRGDAVGERFGKPGDHANAVRQLRA